MHLVDEIEGRVASVAQDGKKLVYRAMLLRALQDLTILHVCTV